MPPTDGHTAAGDQHYQRYLAAGVGTLAGGEPQAGRSSVDVVGPSQKCGCLKWHNHDVSGPVHRVLR